MTQVPIYNVLRAVLMFDSPGHALHVITATPRPVSG